MNIKLTISILLSDRINTIEKCLESLVPLLQQVPSELILTITGKDPKVRELAKQYTEHLIDYTWTDDFSDARNKGLREAKGEWFMFLDDDEWFDDVNPLIQFFQGEDKLYNGVTYRVRNYGDWEGKKYHESHSARIVRFREDLAFEGKVHEHYNKIFAPIKDLDIFVHHYGYVKKKRETGSCKVSRNLPILLKMVEENINNQGAIVQIVQEYANIQELDKTEQYCHMGLKLEQEYRNIQNDSWLYWMFVKVAFSKYGVNKAIQIANEGIQKGKLNEAGNMQLYGMLVTFYMIAKEYHNVKMSLEKYLTYYKLFKANRQLCHEQTRGLIVVEEIMRMREELLYFGVQASIMLEQYEVTLSYLKQFPWNTPNMLYSYYNKLNELLDGLSKEKREKFQECFVQIESDDEFILLQKILYAHRMKQKEEVLRYYEQLKTSEDIRIRLYLIWISGDYKYNIDFIVNKMGIDEWQLLLIELLKLVEVEEYYTYCETMKQLLGVENPYYQILKFRFLEQEMLDEQMSGKRLENCLEQYTKTVISYYQQLYREEVVIKKQARCILPAEYAFSLYYQESLQEGNDQIECLKKAKNAYPRMLVVIKRLMEHLLREYDKKNRVVNAEFQQLGVQVKQQVKQMIDNQQYEVALPIISQLIQLLPSDLEVIRLKQQILTKMNE